MQILSNGILVEFGIEKSLILVMKRGKVTSTQGVELPSGGIIKHIEKEIEKIEKYGPLKGEIARLWYMRKVSVVSVLLVR